MGRTRAAVAAVGIVAVAWVTSAASVASSGASPSSLSRSVSAAVDPALSGLSGTVNIVVQGARSAESSVARMGGKITHDLPLIDGFSASVPATAIARIAKLPGVRAITNDGKVKVMAAPFTSGGPNTPQVYQDAIGATALKAAGDNGHGVTVALIDTGVSSMADTAGQLTRVYQSILGPLGPSAMCQNFAGDGTCNDGYGHGTFLAGLINGTGAASGGQYAGVAPGAKLLSVKVAGADGSADVSTIIAAIQWVVAFKNTYGIKVLNLSLGTDSSQTYLLSPLDYAVESAWNSGIVTIVSASNLGPGASTVDKPADDPFIITVGASDDHGTATVADDTVAPYSSRGPTKADGLAKPDIVVPGTGVVSLAAPGATITTMFPPGMAAPYRQGAGTSMSAAIVSGLVADILSAKPSWTPNRVKFALMSTAHQISDTDPMAVGAGSADGFAALTAPAGQADQGLTAGTGLGSLQADRGSVGVQVDGVGGTTIANPLTGEVTATVDLKPWNVVTMLLTALNPTTWWGSSWGGSSWGGSSWGGSSWGGSSWGGSSWGGSSWGGGAWYGAWE